MHLLRFCSTVALLILAMSFTATSSTILEINSSGYITVKEPNTDFINSTITCDKVCVSAIKDGCSGCPAPNHICTTCSSNGSSCTKCNN